MTLTEDLDHMLMMSTQRTLMTSMQLTSAKRAASTCMLCNISDHVHSDDHCKFSHWFPARLYQYINTVLVRVCEKTHCRLHSTQKTLAWIVAWRYERRSIIHSLQNLHWLPIQWRIDFKIALTTYMFHYMTNALLLQARMVQPHPKTFTSECQHQRPCVLVSRTRCLV